MAEWLLRMTRISSSSYPFGGLGSNPSYVVFLSYLFFLSYTSWHHKLSIAMLQIIALWKFR